MLLLCIALAHAGDGASSFEVGPTGPTVAAFFNDDATLGWLSFTAVVDPSALDERVPIPIPGFSIGVGRTGAIGDGRYRVGVGYNTLVFNGLALSWSEPWAPWLFVAAVEAEAHVLVPAFGPGTHVSFGIRPRGYSVLAVTAWAQSEDPAELWTFLGPTVGVYFGE